MTTLPTDKPHASVPTNKPYHERYHAAHHFKSCDHEFDAVKMGTWLFLATEVLLFSGLFVFYGIMRMLHPEAFAHGSSLLDWRWGLINTVVLLASSYTAAAAVRDAQLNRQFWLKVNLAFTLLAGVAFLAIKVIFEYLPKIADGKLPGKFFNYPNWVDPNEPLWWGLYWGATGVHASHVIVGIFLYAWLFRRATKLHFGPKHYNAVEVVALYWHIVDIVWIFLFPMLYLIH
jgi:cytochrome c oxidase subunit 3